MTTAEKIINWIIYGKEGEYPTGKEVFEKARLEANEKENGN